MPRGGPDAGFIDRAYETDEAEWLDDPAVDDDRKRDVIAGLDRFNRRSFAYHLFCRWVLREIPAGSETARVLELGAGHGELSVRVARSLRDQRRQARVVASDISTDLVARMCSSSTMRELAIAPAVLDATKLAVPDGSFDVAVFTQSLHHLSPEQVIDVMREGTRVARTLLIVDGWRSPVMLAISPAFFVLGNYAAFHDGIISLRKMYGASAIRHLAGRAGVRAEVQFRFPGYMVCVARR